ncbi:MAG: hypothetical protein COA78_06600 [Blastopirellula sp.]|nr:MAG: hypothetical protein COA78_06600 [Blastopirellula sp.]
MSIRLLFALGIMPLLASTASAQWYHNSGAKAATIEESHARGLADVVRSSAEANLNNSAAAINVEEARSKYIANRNEAQQVYFEMRRRNDAYRKEKAGPKPTSEQLFRLNKQRAPKRLSNAEIDPLTGEIAWPFLLTDTPYSEHRTKLDKAFTARAEHGSYSSVSQYNEVTSTANDMSDLLKSKIRDYKPQEYTNASSFMKALIYDAQFPSG